MTKFLILFAALFPSLLHAQVADFNKAASSYLTKLKESSLPIFFTACTTNEGKSFLVFGGRMSKGMLFEIENNDVINAAAVTIKKNKISIGVEETQGGIYTYTIMQNHAIDMIDMPFTFLMPNKAADLLKSIPKYACVDKPPTPQQ